MSEDEARRRSVLMRRAGARKLDELQWRALVEKAVENREKEFIAFNMAWRETQPKVLRYRHIVCGPHQVPVDCQMILDLELAMSELDMMRAELEEMGAQELLDEGYGARIRNTIEQVMRSIEEKEKAEKRSHLRVMDGGEG